MNMIVAYDIANPRRLNRIARVMKDYGVRVQKSIFEIEVNASTFAEMRFRAEDVMNRYEDGVKFFPLCDRCADTLIALGVCARGLDERSYVIV